MQANLFKKAVLGTVLLAAALMSAPASAHWNRIIGTFCIQGIPDKARNVVGTGSVDGVEYEDFDVDYRHSKDSDPWPIVRVFKDIPQAPGHLPDCSDLNGEVVLEGRVRYLKIKKGRETVPGEPKAILILPANALDIELVRAKAEMKLFGGTMRVGKGIAAASNSGWASITNKVRISVQGGAVAQGAIELESWGRDLIGAKVVMPGTDRPTTLNMSSGNTKVTVQLPLAGGDTIFQLGKFTAKKVPLAAPAVVLPGAKFGGFNGVATDVALKADKDAVNLVISNLGYTTSISRFQAPLSLVATGAATGSIESIVAAAGRGGDAIALHGPEVTNLVTDAKDCGYDMAGASLVGASTCNVSVLKGKGVERNWSFSSGKPSSLFAASALKTAAAVKFTSVVNDDNEDFKGVLEDAVVQFGAMGLQKQQMLLANPTGPAGAIKIPFSLEAAPGSGTWSLSLPDGKLSVEGTLSAAKIKGLVTLDLADISAYAVDIAKNDLAFQGKVAVTHEPYLYGARPSYGALGLGFSSDTDLHITKDGGTGTIAASSDVLVLADPIIALGDEDEALVLTGLHRFAAGVVLAFDLKTGNGEVRTGVLQVAGVKLRNKPGKAGDLGGVRMWEGEATLGQLQAKFHDGSGAFGIYNVGLQAKKLGAVPKGDDDGPGNQLVWTGTLKTALGIQSIEGEIVKDPETKALKIEKPLITEAKVGLSDIQMGQGNSLRMQGGDLDVHLAKWGEESAKGSLSLRDSHLASREKNDNGMVDIEFDLEVLDVRIDGGTAKAPNGRGKLRTKNIDLQTDIMFKINESCEDKPDFQGPKVHVSVKSGPSDIDFTVAGGAIKGDGEAKNAVIYAHSTEEYDCHAKFIRWVVWEEKRAIYHYPCPTWRYPSRMCEGWTRVLPEFSINFDRKIKVRHLEIPSFFTKVTINIDGTDKIKACGKYGPVIPLADLSYYLTPDTSWDGLDNILDAVMDAASRPFASQLITSVGALAGNLMMLDKGVGCY